MRKVLFVCTGNMIRSPMAEYLLQNRLLDMGIRDILAESAGTLAAYGNYAMGLAVALMNEQGVDMSAHRTRELTHEMIHEADIIVCMEKIHVQRALELAPHARKKIILAGSLIPDENIEEIDDPIGGKKGDYALALKLIKKATDALAQRLSEYSGPNQGYGPDVKGN